MQIENYLSIHEQEDLFQALTERALANKPTSWEYIKTPVELFILIQVKQGLRKVIRLYKLVEKSIYLNYCKQVQKGEQDFEMLLALCQYQVCKNFYIAELHTVIDMLEEYDAYLGKGHFLDQFLFRRPRESWHCWDHRGVGPVGD